VSANRNTIKAMGKRGLISPGKGYGSRPPSCTEAGGARGVWRGLARAVCNFGACGLCCGAMPPRKVGVAPKKALDRAKQLPSGKGWRLVSPGKKADVEAF
jgi:hypothetical protein